MPGDFRLTAETGWISDRNFLEEYYKREWDELKDETTGVELKRSYDNISWSVTADARLNRFLHPDRVAAAVRPFLAGPAAVERHVHLVRAFQRRLCPMLHGQRARRHPAKPASPVVL